MNGHGMGEDYLEKKTRATPFESIFLSCNLSIHSFLLKSAAKNELMMSLRMESKRASKISQHPTFQRYICFKIDVIEKEEKEKQRKNWQLDLLQPLKLNFFLILPFAIFAFHILTNGTCITWGQICLIFGRLISRKKWSCSEISGLALPWLRNSSFGAGVVRRPVDPTALRNVAAESLVQNRVEPALFRRARKLSVTVRFEELLDAFLQYQLKPFYGVVHEMVECHVTDLTTLDWDFLGRFDPCVLNA